MRFPVLALALLAFSNDALRAQPLVECGSADQIQATSCGLEADPLSFDFDLVQSRSLYFPRVTGLAIPSNDPAGVTDLLDIPAPTCGPIEDVNVSVDVVHTFVGELTITLTSPSGTTVTLLDAAGGDADNLLLTFDDEGIPFNEDLLNLGALMQTDPTPGDLLSSFDGEAYDESVGSWALQVVDSGSAGAGALNDWTLILGVVAGVPYGNSGGVPGAAVDFQDIPDSVVVGDVNVGIDVTSAFVGDVEITLTHLPTATLVMLLAAGAGGNGQNISTTFDDEGYTFTPALLAEGLNMKASSGMNALSTLDGVDTAGTWAIQVVDVAPGENDGCLDHWSLRIEPDVSISLDGPISDTMVVDLTSPILDVDCSVDITSTFVGDLVVDLSSPEGDTVRLHNQLGISSVGLIMVFDDEGGPNQAPYDTGVHMQPSGPGDLLDFDGQDPAGTWTLDVLDLIFGGDRLHQWCLIIVTENQVEYEDSASDTAEFESYGIVRDLDVFVDIATDFVGDQVVDLTSPQGVTVRLHDGAGGIANDLLMTFDDEGVANGAPYDEEINMQPSGPGTLADFDDLELNGSWTLEVEDLAPNGVNVLENWCVFVDPDDVVIHTYQPDETVFESSVPSLPLSSILPPAIDVISSAPNPGGVFMVADLDLGLEVDHTSIGDLTIDLISPSATSVRIHNHGGSSADDIFVFFDDEGAPHGSVPYSGGVHMQPSGPGTLSDFDGEEGTGDWALVVTDNVFGDDGVFNGWALVYTRGDPFEGATTASAVIPVPDNIILTDVNIEAAISESARGDLLVEIVSPEGTTVTLQDGSLGGSDDHVLVTWDDAGVANGSAPFTSREHVQPTGPGTLSDFNGENMLGDWTLTANDDTDDPGAVDGFLQEVRLILTGSEPFCEDVAIDIVTASPPAGQGPLTVDFGATVTGDAPLAYLWDFGDGEISSESNPSHTYVTPGEYTVVLAVSNACPSIDLATTTVTVEASSPQFIRGDADGNGNFSALVDGVWVLNFGFTMGSPPPCLESADADGNGAFSALVDGVYILGHGFTMGPPPPAPYPTCGPDPEPASSLGCGSHPGCP